MLWCVIGGRLGKCLIPLHTYHITSRILSTVVSCLLQYTHTFIISQFLSHQPHNHHLLTPPHSPHTSGQDHKSGNTTTSFWPCQRCHPRPIFMKSQVDVAKTWNCRKKKKKMKVKNNHLYLSLSLFLSLGASQTHRHYREQEELRKAL